MIFSPIAFPECPVVWSWTIQRIWMNIPRTDGKNESYSSLSCKRKRDCHILYSIQWAKLLLFLLCCHLFHFLYLCAVISICQKIFSKTNNKHQSQSPSEEILQILNCKASLPAACFIFSKCRSNKLSLPLLQHPRIMRPFRKHRLGRLMYDLYKDKQSSTKTSRRKATPIACLAASWD